MKEYFELLKKIMRNGRYIKVRGFEIKELIGEQIILDPILVLYKAPSRSLVGESLPAKYLNGEIQWYLSGDRKIDYIIKYSKFWKKIANPDGTVNSNYGYLTLYEKNEHGFTPYEWARTQLLKDKNSRQAIMLYNKPKYLYNENKDIICTQTQQFLIRDEELHSIVYIRSSDVIRGLSFDIPWYSIVTQKLLMDLKEIYKDLRLGKLYINFGSVHIYKEHFKLVKSLIYEYDRNRIDYVKLTFKGDK